MVWMFLLIITSTKLIQIPVRDNCQTPCRVFPKRLQR